MQARPTNLLDFNHADLQEFFLERDQKSFRATQVLRWIYQHGVDEFAAMTNLSQALRSQLGHIASLFALSMNRVIHYRDHSDMQVVDNQSLFTPYRFLHPFCPDLGEFGWEAFKKEIS